MFFKRFHVFPDVGGYNDQGHKFIMFLTKVLRVEKDIYGSKKGKGNKSNNTNKRGKQR